MTTTAIDSKVGAYVIIGNRCCKKCKHYIKGFDQIASPYCTTCSRISIVKTDRFEEKEE